MTGLSTKKATLKEALRRLVRQHHRRKAMENLAGVGWCGDLEEMRRDRDDPAR